jgi:heme/copper-type cytochrome/quinol oxidase subunit 2
MFRIEILQNQWLLMSILGGIAAMVFFLLAYLSFFKPRLGATDTPEKNWAGAWMFLPWFLIVTVIGTLVFMIFYTVYFIKNPPNW